MYRYTATADAPDAATPPTNNCSESASSAPEPTVSTRDNHHVDSVSTKPKDERTYMERLRAAQRSIYIHVARITSDIHNASLLPVHRLPTLCFGQTLLVDGRDGGVDGARTL